MVSLLRDVVKRQLFREEHTTGEIIMEEIVAYSLCLSWNTVLDNNLNLDNSGL